MEVFEFIKGYENLYMINKNGDIYSCKYKKNLKQNICGSNYYYVSLRKNGRSKKHKVHRLVLSQWIPNVDNKPHIDHIDRNKINNCLTNLRWTTCQENSHNKANYFKNLTPEQLEERINKRKEMSKEYRRRYKEKIKMKKSINNIFFEKGLI